jgi:hypothetical protein
MLSLAPSLGKLAGSLSSLSLARSLSLAAAAGGRFFVAAAGV